MYQPSHTFAPIGADAPPSGGEAAPFHAQHAFEHAPAQHAPAPAPAPSHQFQFMTESKV